MQAVSGRKATVRVEEPLSPPVAGLPAGPTVQVRLADGEKVARGESAIFDVSGWEVGDSVVLLSVGHRSPPASGRPEPHRAPRRQARPADVVVSGTVSRVTPAPAPARSYVTEHDPKWHDAVVKVDSTLQGDSPGQEVVVRFPASDDVAFLDAPKLAPGQTGTFMLKRETSKSGPPVFKAVGVRDVRQESRAHRKPSPPSRRRP